MTNTLTNAINETVTLEIPGPGGSHKKEKSGNKELDRELSLLRVSMESKMHDLDDLARLTESSKPAAHILENVMADLEQRNSELASLFRSSEKNRADMDEMLKEQNDELKTLRANTVTMRTLENEVNELTEKNHELEELIKTHEHDIHIAKKQETTLHNKISDVERQSDNATKDQNARISDLLTRIKATNDSITEKDSIIQKTEQTVKELFEKCQQIGGNAVTMKKELVTLVDTGKSLKDMNTKLQYCKDYLEEQLDVLIKELKASKDRQEQLKVDYTNINTEKQDCAKQIVLLNEELSESSNEVNQLKANLRDIQTHLKEFESGEARSEVVVNEIKKERRMFQGVKETLEKKIADLETKKKVAQGELHNATLYEKRQNARMMEMESKLRYFQENFIEKQELLRAKNEMEVKYKLDMNAQLKNVSSMFDKEHDMMVRTMKQSLTLREELMDSDLTARASTHK